MFRRFLLTLCLMLSTPIAFAADVIPPQLTGIWVGDGTVLQDNQMLTQAQGQAALYVNANGKAVMMVAYPPIGLEAVAHYDEQTHVLSLDMTDGREQVRVSMTYDEKRNVLVFDDEGQVRTMTRKAERLSPQTIRYLHLE